ncbi:hypothetical protein DFH06DRAFT_1318120 [Mycena polygramma]|nr:hypothetical protein DFH06DRAFT_1318120 [Mycena polygramma]
MGNVRLPQGVDLASKDKVETKALCRTGSVGTVTQDGSFDFYFNIFLPAGHPINANGVPTDFVPMEPYDLADVLQHNYAPGAYVATPSVQESGHLSNGTPIGRFVFRCEGPQGAILALPDGSHIRKLRDVEPMRAYAQEHAENWYEYINGARGRELSNGSLYLITGCEKARSWGIASYSAAHEGFLLTFEPGAGAHDSGYHWTTGGPALTKTSSPSPADSPTNQTTFIHGLSISLGTGLWGRLFGTGTTSPIADILRSNTERGGYRSTEPQKSLFSWAFNFFGAGGNEDALENYRDTVSPDSAPIEEASTSHN